MVYSLKSIAKGSALYTFGQVLTKASAFLLIPLYTRYLTPSDYGIVGYLQFALQILATVLMFGFYGAQARFFYEYKKDLRVIGEFLFTINLWLLSTLVPIALLVGFFGIYIYEIIGPDDLPFSPYVPLIVWTAVFQVMNQMVVSYHIAKKEYFRTTILQIFQFGMISGVTIFWVVLMQSGAEGYFKGLLYGQIIFFIVAYPSYSRRFICKINWKYIIYSLSFGWPIVIHLLSGTMHTSIDRAILAKMVPMDQLGLYTLGYQVGMAMYIFAISVNNAWQPNYYDLMESQDKNKWYHIGRTYNLWLVFMSFICSLGILWGGDILRLLTPEQYHGAAKVVPLVFLGYFFHGLYLFVVLPIFFHKKTKVLFIFTGSATVVNIGLNLLLIPLMGITGAALATTISMFFQASAVYMFSKRFNNHGIRLIATVVISIVLGLSLIVPFCYENNAWPQFIRIGILLFIIIYSSLSMKQELKNVFSKIQKK